MNGKPDKNCQRCGGSGRLYTYSRKPDCTCLTRTTPCAELVRCPLCGTRSTRREDGKTGELSRHGSLGWSCNGLILDRR